MKTKTQCLADAIALCEEIKEAHYGDKMTCAATHVDVAIISLKKALVFENV